MKIQAVKWAHYKYFRLDFMENSEQLKISCRYPLAVRYIIS